MHNCALFLRLLQRYAYSTNYWTGLHYQTWRKKGATNTVNDTTLIPISYPLLKNNSQIHHSRYYFIFPLFSFSLAVCFIFRTAYFMPFWRPHCVFYEKNEVQFEWNVNFLLLQASSSAASILPSGLRSSSNNSDSTNLLHQLSNAAANSNNSSVDKSDKGK